MTISMSIQVKGLAELERKFKGLPPVLKAYLARAGKRYAPVLLDVQGVRKYPPTTAANVPPTPYYIRGEGTQYASYNKGESEQYGLRFTIESQDTKTTIGNTASYSKWLADAYQQAAAMAKIGWVKLIDAAKRTQGQALQIYNEEVNRALQVLGLK